MPYVTRQRWYKFTITESEWFFNIHFKYRLISTCSRDTKNTIIGWSPCKCVHKALIFEIILIATAIYNLSVKYGFIHNCTCWTNHLNHHHIHLLILFSNECDQLACTCAHAYTWINKSTCFHVTSIPINVENSSTRLPGAITPLTGAMTSVFHITRELPNPKTETATQDAYRVKLLLVWLSKLHMLWLIILETTCPRVLFLVWHTL